jgi:hypothetical protein
LCLLSLNKPESRLEGIEELLMASRLNARPNGPDNDSKQLEGSARVTLDALAGRVLTHAEWLRASAQLLKFMTILRNWDRKAETTEASVGNVILLSKPRP